MRAHRLTIESEYELLKKSKVRVFEKIQVLKLSRAFSRNIRLDLDFREHFRTVEDGEGGVFQDFERA